MGSGRRKPKLTAAAKAREDRQAIIRSIETSLSSQPIDVDTLRGIAIHHGFVNKQVRAKVWPALLGAKRDSHSAPLEQSAVRDHRDSSVVECDIQRSLWSFTEDWTDETRAAKREELRKVLTAAVTQEDQEVYYYQGLHDIAAVLLFEVGQDLAANLLTSLSTSHLRDFTRATLDAALELLNLLPTLLEQADKELSDHIAETGIPPYYALSWLITWFAHNVASLEKITRAFDVLLASHPMMPLYMCAANMKRSKERIIMEQDPSELHRLLSNLPVFQSHTVEQIATDADRLLKSYPPDKLLKESRARVERATAVEARSERGIWIVPDKKQATPGNKPSQLVQAWAAWAASNTAMTGKKLRRQPMTLQLLGGLVLVSSGLFAMYASQSWQG